MYAYFLFVFAYFYMFIRKQCRRQSKRSKGALAERGGALKLTQLLHIKTDILPPQIMRYFENVVLMSKKRRIRPAAILSLFHMRPIQSLEKSVAVNAPQVQPEFAKRKGLEPKVNFFCTKID